MGEKMEVTIKYGVLVGMVDGRIGTWRDLVDGLQYSTSIWTW